MAHGTISGIGLGAGIGLTGKQHAGLRSGCVAGVIAAAGGKQGKSQYSQDAFIIVHFPASCFFSCAQCRSNQADTMSIALVR